MTTASTATPQSASATATPTAASPITSPGGNLPAVAGGFLVSVACSSTINCWAVGGTKLNPSGSGAAILDHMDGTTWTRDTADLSAGAVSLKGVACDSGGECWVVGSTGSSTPTPLVAHNAGSGWRTVNSPTLPVAQLQSVTCWSSNDCWTVGASFTGGNASAVAEHYDGKAWSTVPAPTPQGGGFLTAVACVATADCWAAGNATVIPQVPLIEHYDGHAWSITPPTQLGTGNLSGVACPTSTSCWAVGLGYGTDLGAALIDRYDGASWSVVRTTDLAGAPNLSGVACSGATDCWSVGVASMSPAAFHFDGTAWTATVLPSAPPGGGALLSVACPAPRTCWAVGYLGIKIGDPSGTTFVQSLG